jgi:hypothetical protein
MTDLNMGGACGDRVAQLEHAAMYLILWVLVAVPGFLPSPRGPAIVALKKRSF